MNKSKRIQLIFFVFFGALMFSQAYLGFADNDYGTGAFNTPALFEENMLLPAFDMWINQSVSAMVKGHIDKYGVEAVESGYVMRHLFFVPPSVDLADLKILDKTLEVITPTEFEFTKGYVDDAGYYGFSSSDTDLKIEYDQSTLGSETNTIDVDETSLPIATEPTGANYTHPDSVPITGVAYTAGDGKSINEFASEQAEADGGVLYDIANATFISFSFDDFDNLVSLNVAFDEEFATSPTSVKGEDSDEEHKINAGVLKRIRCWLHNRKMSRKIGGLGGMTSTVHNSAFRSITNAGSTLPAIASRAKQFISKAIGAGFFKRIFSVNSLGSGAMKTAIGWVIGLFSLILGIAVIYIIVKQAKKRRS